MSYNNNNVKPEDASETEELLSPISNKLKDLGDKMKELKGEDKLVKDLTVSELKELIRDLIRQEIAQSFPTIGSHPLYMTSLPEEDSNKVWCTNISDRTC